MRPHLNTFDNIFGASIEPIQPASTRVHKRYNENKQSKPSPFYFLDLTVSEEPKKTIRRQFDNANKSSVDLREPNLSKSVQNLKTVRKRGHTIDSVASDFALKSLY